MPATTIHPERVGNAVFLFDGGLERHHRSRFDRQKGIESSDVAFRLRMALMSYDRVLVHPGNLIEEEPLFAAVAAHPSALAEGRIALVMPPERPSLGEYGTLWREGYKNPSNPSFFQGRRVSKGALRKVDRRVEELSGLPHQVVIADPATRRMEFRDLLLRLLKENAEAIALDEEDLSRVQELSLLPSALGRMRESIIDGRYQKSSAIRTLTSVANLAYFWCTAYNGGGWFSVADRAVLDVDRHLPSTSWWPDAVELAIGKVLDIDGTNQLTGIREETFTKIITSPGSEEFRSIVSEIGSSLGAGDPSVPSRIEVDDLSDCFRDTLKFALEQEIKRRLERDEWARRRANAYGFVFDALALVLDGPLGVLSTLRWLPDSAKDVFGDRVWPILSFQTRLKRGCGSSKLVQERKGASAPAELGQQPGLSSPRRRQRLR